MEDCSDLHVSPCSATRRLDVALVELRCDGVVASRAGSHDLLNDRPYDQQQKLTLLETHEPIRHRLMPPCVERIKVFSPVCEK